MSLSNKALVLAEQPVHPILGLKPGINYREWLIGQALTGFCACEGARNQHSSTMVKNTIDVVDALLERMATEGPPKGSYTEG